MPHRFCSNMRKGFPRQWGTVCHNAPHCKPTIVGASLVGARIAIHSQATIAMIAMMVVVLQCEAMRGDASNVSHRPHCVVPPCPSLTHQCNLRAAALKTRCKILGGRRHRPVGATPPCDPLKPRCEILGAVGPQTPSRRLTLMRMGVPPLHMSGQTAGFVKDESTRLRVGQSSHVLPATAAS